MSLPKEAVPARLHAGGDGDSFDLLVNWKHKPSFRDAVVCNIRLLGYGARESTGRFKDAAETAPDGTLIRMSGVDAKKFTTDTLKAADGLAVAFTGRITFGRDLCDVWVHFPDEAEWVALGPWLEENKVVKPGETMGVHG